TFHLRDLRDDGPDRIEKSSSAFCQLYALADSYNEFRSVLLFQEPKLLGNGGLAHVEVVRCSRNVQMPNHRFENSQLMQGHDLSHRQQKELKGVCPQELGHKKS